MKRVCFTILLVFLNVGLFAEFNAGYSVVFFNNANEPDFGVDASCLFDLPVGDAKYRYVEQKIGPIIGFGYNFDWRNPVYRWKVGFDSMLYKIENLSICMQFTMKGWTTKEEFGFDLMPYLLMSLYPKMENYIGLKESYEVETGNSLLLVIGARYSIGKT